MINEFLNGSGDMHSLCAYMVYTDIIPRNTPIKDIKKLYPHQRKEVKSIEFSQQFVNFFLKRKLIYTDWLVREY